MLRLWLSILRDSSEAKLQVFPAYQQKHILGPQCRLQLPTIQFCCDRCCGLMHPSVGWEGRLRQYPSQANLQPAWQVGGVYSSWTPRIRRLPELCVLRCSLHWINWPIRRSAVGEKKGLPLELPKTYARTQLAWLCARQQSGSILFIDGKNAYYAAVRNLLHTDGGFGDGLELLRFVEAVFSDEEDRRCLYTALVGPGILAESCAPTTLHNYIRATVDKTWFSLDLGSGACYKTLTGTSPGAPLADVLYQLISTRFLDQVKCALEASGHLTTADNGAAAPLPGWADDYAVLLEATSADAAIRQLQEVAPHIFSALRQTGIELNLTKGKTEALLVLHGAGSRKLQQQIHNDHCPGIDFLLPKGQQKRLCVTRKYVHLGGVVTDTGSLVADLRQIIGDAERIFSRLRPTLLRNRHLSCDERVRVHLFHSLVLSKIQQGAMTWFLRTGGEYNLLTSALDKWHRSMIGPIFGCSARGSDAQEIRTVIGRLSAQQILDTAHVRWLAGVAGNCCDFLSRRLCQHGQWLKEAPWSFLLFFAGRVV